MTLSSDCKELGAKREPIPKEIPASVTPNKSFHVSLRKSLGFFNCVALLVGTIIGSGIFVSPQGVLRGSGSVGLTLVIWLLCGFFAFLGALAYAELGTLIPSSGGQYIYFLECFAPTRKKEKLFWGPLIAFLYSWQFNLFARPAVFAIQALACAKYLSRLASPSCKDEEHKSNSELEIKLLASFLMILTTLINCYSVKSSTRIVTFFMVAKISGLCLIIIAGTLSLVQGSDKSLSSGFQGSNWSYHGISLAFYSGLFPFAGWSRLNNVTRELENPKRDFPRSLMTSMIFITMIYMFTNVSYFAILTKEEFLKSDEIAVDIGAKSLGNLGVIIMVLCVASSIFGSIIGGVFMSIRVCYAAAREGQMINLLSFLSIKYMTPVPALLLSLIIGLFLVCNSTVLGLIFLAGFVGRIFVVISMISLLIMRKTKECDEQTFKVPTIVPVLVLLFSVFLVIIPFIENPKIEYLYTILFMLIGFIVYVPFVYFEFTLPGLDAFTTLAQKILLIFPPEDKEL